MKIPQGPYQWRDVSAVIIQPDGKVEEVPSRSSNAILEVLLASAPETEELVASRVLYQKSKDLSLSEAGRRTLESAAENQAIHESLRRWWEVPEPEDTL